MSTYKRTLKDENGNTIIPVTSTNAVFDGNGNTVETLLENAVYQDNNTTPTDVPPWVTSVNNQTGTVQLDGTNINVDDTVNPPVTIKSVLDNKQDTLVPVETFSLTYASTITDLSILAEHCYYDPNSRRVDIFFYIYSASNLIPGKYSTLATIPSGYRPLSNISSIAEVIDTTPLASTQTEKITAFTNGTIQTMYFDLGKDNYRIVSSRFIYYI